MTQSVEATKTLAHRPQSRFGWGLIVVSLVALWAYHVATGYWERSLGWDESVYFSQVASDHAPSDFGPHRSRMITYLVAPMGSLTDSVGLLRTYLLVATSLAYGALFYRLRHAGRWAQTGFGLFTVALIPLHYASVLSPNPWVAIVAMFILTVIAFRLRHRKTDLAALALSAGVLAYLRPIDAAYFTAAALLTMVAVSALRDWKRIVAVAGGALVGVSIWLGQTLSEHGPLGDVVAEVTAAVPTSFSPRMLVLLTAIDGPLITTRFSLVRPEALLPGLLLVGILWVIGTRDLERVEIPESAWALAILCITCGIAMSFHYLFLTEVSAARFLIATWAMISVGTATLAGRKLSRFSTRWGVALVILLFATQVGVAAHVEEDTAIQAEGVVVLGEYVRGIVGDEDCEVATEFGAPQVMFVSGCVASSVDAANVDRLTATAGDRAFVAFLDGIDQSLGLKGWVEVSTPDGESWSVVEIERP